MRLSFEHNTEAATPRVAPDSSAPDLGVLTRDTTAALQSFFSTLPWRAACALSDWSSCVSASVSDADRALPARSKSRGVLSTDDTAVYEPDKRVESMIALLGLQDLSRPEPRPGEPAFPFERRFGRLQLDDQNLYATTFTLQFADAGTTRLFWPFVPAADVEVL